MTLGGWRGIGCVRERVGPILHGAAVGEGFVIGGND